MTALDELIGRLNKHVISRSDIRLAAVELARLQAALLRIATQDGGRLGESGATNIARHAVDGWQPK